MKIEFHGHNPHQHSLLLNHYRSRFPRLHFLAEKIERRQDYETARELGFHYFQGFFFSKPLVHREKGVRELGANLLRILQELQTPEPSFPRIADIITQDFSLTYKLLRLANSSYFAPAGNIRSVGQALSWLGISELTRWVHLMLLQDLKTPELSELIRTSVIRGRVLEQIGSRPGSGHHPSELFMLGLFSSLDVILDRPMEDALHNLPLTGELRDALLGKPVFQRSLLERLTAYEQTGQPTGDPADLPDLYLEAIRWLNRIL